MQVCKRCVMDSTDSNITFDLNGVCDHCNTFDTSILPSWNFGKGHEKKLSLIINKIKKQDKKRDFDCLLGLSGGIDSSYLLHLVVTKFKLRPLVFHVDAGWNAQIATNNIEKLVDKLDLDLYTEVIDWEEMRSLQLAFFKSGVSHIDTPQDHAFFATMYKFASKHNIKTIITGGNYSTECVRNPKEWMYFQSDSIQLRHINKLYGQYKLKKFPVTNILWHKIWLPYFKGIKLLRLIDFMRYDKKIAEQTLVDEYGFQPYPQKHFESRFTKFYESYWLFKRFGFDTRKVQLSSLILTDQMTRDEALNILKNPPYDPETIKHEFEYIANKLNISINELQSYLDMPLKSYKDYRNQESIYDIGATVLRRFGIEKGGKR